MSFRNAGAPGARLIGSRVPKGMSNTPPPLPGLLYIANKTFIGTPAKVRVVDGPGQLAGEGTTGPTPCCIHAQGANGTRIELQVDRGDLRAHLYPPPASPAFLAEGAAWQLPIPTADAAMEVAGQHTLGIAGGAFKLGWSGRPGVLELTTAVEGRQTTLYVQSATLIRELARLTATPCDPPEACDTHGRCWEHADWAPPEQGGPALDDPCRAAEARRRAATVPALLTPPNLLSGLGLYVVSEATGEAYATRVFDNGKEIYRQVHRNDSGGVWKCEPKHHEREEALERLATLTSEHLRDSVEDERIDDAALAISRIE